ncbi:MAG: ATP-dependent Clp protease adaptor ClpS [Myxococcota bacterium]|nr:ATP-dependent Clp protease adaptor ClpS [Myxococcota bacterium]
MSKKKDTRRDSREDTQVLERLKRPRKHKVIMHNDDYSPMEFVVQILEQIFHHSPAAATRVMLSIHNTGIGIAGVYSLEIAEAKSNRAIRVARDAGFPLMVTTEPE